jgi:hypothetical protein
MLGLLAPTLIAFLAALAVGGSPRTLFQNSLRGWPAIVAAFAIELTLYNPPIDAQPWAMWVGPWLWIVTRLVILSVLVANGWGSACGVVWPWRIAALGVGLNTLVIGVNAGHMPQSLEAAIAVWGSNHIDTTRLQNVAQMDANTRLAWLADTLAEPSWLPRASVVSLGDLLLASGVALWMFAACTTRRATPAKIGARIATSVDGDEAGERGGSAGSGATPAAPDLSKYTPIRP